MLTKDSPLSGAVVAAAGSIPVLLPVAPEVLRYTAVEAVEAVVV